MQRRVVDFVSLERFKLALFSHLHEFGVRVLQVVDVFQLRRQLLHWRQSAFLIRHFGILGWGFDQNNQVGGQGNELLLSQVLKVDVFERTFQEKLQEFTGKGGIEAVYNEELEEDIKDSLLLIMFGQFRETEVVEEEFLLLEFLLHFNSEVQTKVNVLPSKGLKKLHYQFVKGCFVV